MSINNKDLFDQKKLIEKELERCNENDYQGKLTIRKKLEKVNDEIIEQQKDK